MSTATYTICDKGNCQRLVRDQSAGHPAVWPPSDPPTGTPKNGKRSPRQQVVNQHQQLLTPPASQQQQRATSPLPVPVGNTTSTRSAPTTSYPLNHFLRASPEVLIPVTPASDPFFLPTPAAPLGPLYQVDTADDPFLSFDPITPTPAQPASARTFRSLIPLVRMNALHIPRALVPATEEDKAKNAKLVAALQGLKGGRREGVFQPRAAPAASPASTVLVPETPLDQQPAALANHHRRQGFGNRDRSSIASSSNATNHKLQTEIRYLRAERTRLVEQLNDLNALVNRVQVRKQIAELGRLHEQKCAELARLERDVARAATAAAEKRVAWWRYGFAFGMLVIVAYWIWYLQTSVDRAYMRQMRCRQLGMRDDC